MDSVDSWFYSKCQGCGNKKWSKQCVSFHPKYETKGPYCIYCDGGCFEKKMKMLRQLSNDKCPNVLHYVKINGYCFDKGCKNDRRVCLGCSHLHQEHEHMVKYIDSETDN